HHAHGLSGAERSLRLHGGRPAGRPAGRGTAARGGRSSFGGRGVRGGASLRRARADGPEAPGPVIGAAFLRAVSQLREPAFRRVAYKGVAVAGAAFVVLLIVAQRLLVRFVEFEAEWLEWIAELAGLGALIVTLFLLFPAVVAFAVGLF